MNYWQDGQSQKGHQNRRTGPDTKSKYVRFSSFLSWLLIALTALLTDAARPSEFNIYVLDEKWGKSSATYFRENYIIAAAVFCAFTFLLILVSLFIDVRRQKRKTDHISISLLIGLLVTFAGLIGYAVYFLA